jgi:RNA polymerase sigma factor (sigma-70 family)
MDERRRNFEAQALPHFDAAVNLARWLSRSPADAEDIVQDALLRAFRAFDGFRGGDARPWLLAIVRNCWRSHQSRHGRMPLTDDHDTIGEPACEGDSPEASAIRTDHGRKLDRIIASIPDEFREVLILREMEDLSYREIADVTGAPIGTVMSRLARARALLREKWLGQIEGVSRHAVP